MEHTPKKVGMNQALNQKNLNQNLMKVVLIPKVVIKVIQKVILNQKVLKVVMRKIQNQILVLILIEKMIMKKKKVIIKMKKMRKKQKIIMEEKKPRKKKRMNLKKIIIRLKMRKKNTENYLKKRKYAILIQKTKKVKMRKKFLGLFYQIIHIKKCGIYLLPF